MNTSSSLLFFGGLNAGLNANTTVPTKLGITVTLAVSFTILVSLICVTVLLFGGVVDPVSKTFITFRA
jgi:hypothetical protein